MRTLFVTPLLAGVCSSTSLSAVVRQEGLGSSLLSAEASEESTEPGQLSDEATLGNASLLANVTASEGASGASEGPNQLSSSGDDPVPQPHWDGTCTFTADPKLFPMNEQKECDKLCRPSTEFITNVFLSVLDTGVLVIFILIGYRVFKIIRFHNKTIIAMIFFLNCQLLSKLFMFSINANIYNHICSASYKAPVYTILPMSPVMCLTFAAILNLNNWIVYYIKIGEMASHVDERAQKFGEPKRIKRMKLIINLITIFAFLIVIGFCSWLTIYTMTEDIDKINMLTGVSGCTFLVLGTIFGVTGIMNNHRLYKYFEPFYLENRRMLMLATLGLSVPLIVRGTLDTLRYKNKSFDKLIGEHQAIYDTMLYLLLDLVPIGFQLSSLVFGYIRQQKNKKAKLDMNAYSSKDEDRNSSRRSILSSYTDTTNFFDPPLLDMQSSVMVKSIVYKKPGKLPPGAAGGIGPVSSSSKRSREPSEVDHNSMKARLPSVPAVKEVSPSRSRFDSTDRISQPSTIYEQHETLLKQNSIRLTGGFTLGKLSKKKSSNRQSSPRSDHSEPLSPSTYHYNDQVIQSTVRQVDVENYQNMSRYVSTRGASENAMPAGGGESILRDDFQDPRYSREIDQTNQSSHSSSENLHLTAGDRQSSRSSKRHYDYDDY